MDGHDSVGVLTAGKRCVHIMVGNTAITPKSAPFNNYLHEWDSEVKY